MPKDDLAELTLVDLLVHPDPIIRRCIQSIVNRFEELEKEQEKREEKSTKLFIFRQ